MNNYDKRKDNEWYIIVDLIIFFFSILIIVGTCIYAVIYRTKNPTLTNTQIVLWYFGKFWILYLISIITGKIATNYINSN